MLRRRHRRSSADRATRLASLKKRALWTAALAIVLPLVVGQTPVTPIPPGATPAPPVDDFRSIYSNGDLILVNPQQSTFIFLSVTASSTFIEWFLEYMGDHRNKYVRIIFFAIKEELTCISFAEMVLLFVAFSFPLVRRWRLVIQWVVMCLLFISIGFSAMVTSTVTLLRVRAQKWRAFEWARIEADAHHSRQEALFKMSRRFFIEKIQERLVVGRGQDNLEIPVVVFSSFINRIQRNHLKELADFTVLTWAGLAVVIIINGSRSITAASIAGDNNIAQIISYLLVMGYGTSAAFEGYSYWLHNRLRSFIARTTLLKQSNSGSGRNDDEDEEEEEPQQALNFHERKARRSSAQRRVNDGPSAQQCLLFRKVKPTLEVAKALMLAMIWYAAVLVMAFVYVTYKEVGWFCFIIYFFAVLPPLHMVWRLPWFVTVVSMCSALGNEFNERTDGQLLDFLGDAEHSGSESKSDDDEAAAAASPTVGRENEVVLEDGVDDNVEDNEWDGEDVTLNETNGEPAALTGPPKLMGVAPTNALQQKFQSRLNRPVFRL